MKPRTRSCNGWTSGPNAFEHRHTKLMLNVETARVSHAKHVSNLEILELRTLEVTFVVTEIVLEAIFFEVKLVLVAR
jgi:hypothetical protein